ncbi:MAG: flagellar basal body rod C-terminal domain-containing protein, partial [Bacteroidota bacterium]
TASSAEADLKNARALMSGFSDRSDSISGVNLDEELANTVIYQNAYTASTRVITVVSELFDALLNTFGR